MTTATEVRELPILFKGWGVRGIQEDRKTQTRRVVKPQPDPHQAITTLHGWDHRWASVNPGCEDAEYVYTCPYGQPGDLLYVRETWRPFSWWPGEPLTVEFRADRGRHECYTGDPEEEERWIEWEERQWERITEELENKGVEPNSVGEYHFDTDNPNPLSWRPSIHMPKWAARIWLRVTDVRVERLQEITPEDAVAEGLVQVGRSKLLNYPLLSANPGADPERHYENPNDGTYDEARMCFADLWDAFNADRGYGWDENPWVWVVEFERAEAP